MSVTRRRFLFVVLGGTVAVGAGPAVWALTKASDADAGPPRIDFGHDRCAQCGMAIGDARYASAVREGDATFVYDDIGCMLTHRAGRLASGAARAFVHDSDTLVWLPAADAWYVRSGRIRTPMNHRIAAFADPAAAQRDFPAATPLRWDDTLRRSARGNS